MDNCCKLEILIFSTVAREACCYLSFTIDSSLSATLPEETHTAGKMLINIPCRFAVYSLKPKWLLHSSESC